MIKLKDILLNEQFSMAGIGTSDMYPSAQAAKSIEKSIGPATKAAIKFINDNRHTLIDISATNLVNGTGIHVKSNALSSGSLVKLTSKSV